MHAGARLRRGDVAADALRADPTIRRTLRMRIADLETRLVDFTNNPARGLVDGIDGNTESSRRGQ